MPDSIPSLGGIVFVMLPRAPYLNGHGKRHFFCSQGGSGQDSPESYINADKWILSAGLTANGIQAMLLKGA